MPAPTAGCLFSIVKNISGGSKHFGFLPPHGRTLDEDEELHIFGNVTEAIYRNGGFRDQRRQDALATALSEADLEIVSSPCLIVYDETDLASYRVGSANAVVDVFEPSWIDESYGDPLS